MPELNKNVKPPHMGEKNPNKKIIKLGKKITDVAGHELMGVTSNDPEYWGLAEIVTDEMADIALAMKMRTPYTFKEMVELTKYTYEEKLQKLLDEMSYIGLLEYDYGYHYDHNGRTAPPSERRYILPMFVPGSAELFNMDEKIAEDGTMSNPRLEEHPALAGFFERMTYIPLKGLTQMIPPGGAGVGMHVIPVEKAIEAESTSIDIEHLSYWLKKYEGHIGVGQCSCRAACAAYCEGVADDQYNWCIGVGDFADYCRETGKGHDITYEEAMHILQVAEDNGFVHQITNIDGENKIFGICNCNVNICYALRTSQLFNTPNLSRSAYTAKVDPKNCVACGKCVEYCPAGAVKLGQKLCTREGEIKYPKHELPTILGWGEDKYDENYRDNNRINCYDTGTAPCKTACPAHIAVQGYLKLASQGKFTEALALIKKDNPLPAICGRICNKRCEEACTRGTVDQPVAIDDVKKYIADLDLNAETRYIPEVVIASNRLDHWDNKIAIIGSGPAGLSCAYYLATKGYKPTVFEKNEKLGGMLMYGIPSYKLEKDVIEAEIDVMRELGVEFKTGVEVGKDVTLNELREQGYEAFYLALGCQGSRKAGIPGEDGEGTDYAVNFLHHVVEKGSWLSGRKVAVVGGGNVAIDCARSARRAGAQNVEMYVLETRETMPALPEEINEALAEDIVINNSWGPKEIIRNENGTIREFVLKRCTSTKDETGRFNPQFSEETMSTDADYIIFAIGQTIEWGDILKDENIQFHHGNYPMADGLTYQTDTKDIFVGGDLYTGPKFAIDAIEAGKCAAESLHRYVHKTASLTIGRNRRDFKELDKKNILLEPSYDKSPRQVNEYRPNLNFRDNHPTLTAEQVKTETARCLGCGASIVDENKCIGCGVCTTKCAFDAIHLFRDHPECSKMVKAEDKYGEILPYAMKNMFKK